MIYLILYFGAGILCMGGAVVTHLVYAERHGYKAIQHWRENGSPWAMYFHRRYTGTILAGVATWPILFIEFIDYDIPILYECYERK